MMKKFMLIVLAISTVLCAAPSAFSGEESGKDSGAEPREEPRGWEGRSDPRARELLESVFTAGISKELALDDEQTVILVRRFGEYREQIMEMKHKRGEAVRGLEEAVREAKDSAAIEAGLAEVMRQDTQMIQLQREAFEATSSDLTPWQKARLYLFLDRFESDMRRILWRAREHAMRDEGGEASGQNHDSWGGRRRYRSSDRETGEDNAEATSPGEAPANPAGGE